LSASDPGRYRLHQAIRVVTCVGITALVEHLLALALGAPSLQLIMTGAVIAMMTASFTSRETQRKGLLFTLGFAPIAAAVGVSSATLLGPYGVVAQVVFVALSVLSVWVRRFGPRWFMYGFLAWQTYFMALFIRATPDLLALLLLSIVVAFVVVTVLLLTLLWDPPDRRLARTVTAFRARIRAALAACLEFVDEPTDRNSQRVRGHMTKLSEVALLFDGQLSEARALPPDVSPSRLRRWVIDLEASVDGVVGAVRHLVGHPDQLAAARPQVDAMLRALGWADRDEARQLAEQVRDDENQPVPVRRLAHSAINVISGVDDWEHGRLARRPDEKPAAGRRSTEQEKEELDEALKQFGTSQDFDPIVKLAGGNLPGSAALTTDTVVDEQARWWSPSRLRLTSRLAVQAGLAAALAIVVGEMISPQRYYWAVITAFIVFTGTFTAGETLRRGVARVVGTAVGLVVAILIAHVTSGNVALSIAIILVAIFIGVYFQPLYQTVMILMITIMLGQLYGLMHTFSDDLLVLRLIETAAGGAIGIAVSMLVLPARSRDVLRQGRRSFLGHLADLLAECASRMRGRDHGLRLSDTVIALEADSRQIVGLARSLVRGRLLGSGRRGVRHRVAVLGSCAAISRGIASLMIAADPDPDDPRWLSMADACEVVAGEARRLSTFDDLAEATPRLGGELGDAVAEKLAGPLNEPDRRATGMLADQIQRLAETLSLLAPRRLTRL